MKLRQCLTALVALLFASGCGSNTGTAAAPGALSGDVAWVKYQDPLEQAFTLDVPKGWTVKGGMFRLGYSDHREMVDMTSPDGKVNIRLGDLAIPTYFLPNQYHHEGEVYDLGAQAQGRVARYRSGQEFARGYAKVRFARVCQNLTPRQTTLPPIIKLDTPQGVSQASEGEATYTCGDRTGYVYAQTALMGGLWQASSLSSYVAPEAQVALTRSIVLHSSKSFQLSPEWIQKQNQLDQEALVYQRQRQQARMQALSAQVRQFEANMQGMRNQVAAFKRGQAQRQSQFQAVDNIISGITPTTDPYGNTVNVFNGPKSHYWYNPGTGEQRNSDSSPGPGWVPLTPQQ
ncbi:MAG: hypothetical protein ACLQVL_15480 [Terriglobia bacterium]